MQRRVAFRAHGVRRHPGVEQGRHGLRHPAHGREVDGPQALGVRRVEVCLEAGKKKAGAAAE